MAPTAIPPGVIDRIVEVLDPDEVWLFGSRARETHGPDSDWDLMAVMPDSAPDSKLDIASIWSALRELRRLRVEVIPIRRRDFEADRDIPGELAEAVAREGRCVHAARRLLADPPNVLAANHLQQVAEKSSRPCGYTAVCSTPRTTIS